MSTISGEHLSNMVQIGFMAGFHGEHQKAEAIFMGLQGIKPDNIDIAMGLAVSKISTGNTLEAINMIERTILLRQPHNNTAKCFLAWAYQLVGNHERSYAITLEVMESKDTAAIALITSLNGSELDSGQQSHQCTREHDVQLSHRSTAQHIDLCTEPLLDTAHSTVNILEAEGK